MFIAGRPAAINTIPQPLDTFLSRYSINQASTAAIMSKLIHRITMFKLAGAEKQAQLMAAYDKLAKEQNKVNQKAPSIRHSEQLLY